MKPFCRRDLWAIRPGDELWCLLPEGHAAKVEISAIAIDDSRLRASTADAALLEFASPWGIGADHLTFVAAGSKRPATAFVLSGPLLPLMRAETPAEAARLAASYEAPSRPTELFYWGDVRFYSAPVLLSASAKPTVEPLILALWPGETASGEAGYFWDQVLWLGPGELFNRWRFANVGNFPGGNGKFVIAGSPAAAAGRIVKALESYEKGEIDPWRE